MLMVRVGRGRGQVVPVEGCCSWSVVFILDITSFVILILILLPIKDAQAPAQRRQEYTTWVGIKHFWGPGGPLELGGHLPNAPENSEADLAQKLKQNHISNHKAGIDKHLRKIPAQSSEVSNAVNKI
jgi:hypothetical protein